MRFPVTLGLFALAKHSLATDTPPAAASQKTCNDDYFAKTRSNFFEAEIDHWYAEWVRTARNDDGFHQLGETTYFAFDQMGWPDMECSIAFMGCKGMPSCEDVLRKFPEDSEKARRIYLTTRYMDNVFMYPGLIYEATTKAQINVQNLIGRAAETFYWQPDNRKVAQCAMIKNVIMSVVNTAIGAAKPIFLGELLSESEFLIAAGVLSTIETIDYWGDISREKREEIERTHTRRQVANIKKSITERRQRRKLERHDAAIGLPWTKRTIGETRGPIEEASWGDQKMKPKEGILIKGVVHDYSFARDTERAVAHWALNYLSTFPSAFIDGKLDQHLCNAYLPSPIDERIKHAADLGDYIYTLFTDMRREMSEVMALIGRGAGFGVNGAFDDRGDSILSDIIASADFATDNFHLRQDLAENPWKVEEKMTQRVSESLISDMLISGSCHIVCFSSPKLAETCNALPQSTSYVSFSRYCPDANTLCQAQCWRPGQRGKNIEMHGIRELEDPIWGSSAQKLIAGSFANYMAYGNTDASNGKNTNPFLNTANSGTVATEPFASLAGSGFNLPVCHSTEFNQVADFFHGHSSHTRIFPCSCGDLFGSETGGFLKKLNFVQDGDNKHIFTQTCPSQLETAVAGLPLEHFLALCALEIHWPVHGELAVSMQLGADKRCSVVLDEAYEVLKQGGEPNRWFCKNSQLGRELRADEHHVMVWHLKHGHNRQCRHFLRTPEIHWEEERVARIGALKGAIELK
ncbi:MAG: hypothetical protein M1829_000377 [Trizodia sp. TS-e1964]|nr:MAG: hypothetical protein M1829_000377 [Trizodia sp. TS-e1964]